MTFTGCILTWFILSINFIKYVLKCKNASNFMHYNSKSIGHFLAFLRPVERKCIMYSYLLHSKNMHEEYNSRFFGKGTYFSYSKE